MDSLVLQDNKQLHYLLNSLGPKERLYVEARVLGSTPVASARVAGFADPDAKAISLEADHRVRYAIEYSFRVQSHDRVYTREYLVSRFEDVFNTATTAMEQVAALREICKIKGAYAPEKREVTIKKEALHRMSDEELAEAAGLGATYDVLDFEEVTEDELPDAPQAHPIP